MLSVGLSIPLHPSCTPQGLCNPPGTGALLSTEGTSLDGTARGWAGVWGLI